MVRRNLRRWARWALVSLPCLPLACSHLPDRPASEFTPMHLAPESPVDAPMGIPITSNSQSPSPLDDDRPEVVRASAAAPDLTAQKTLPISIDTVLRLAEEQNPQIRVARAKVGVALAERESAKTRWLPDLFVGLGYWRHAGGIQLQEGPLITSDTGAYSNWLQLNAEYNPREFAFRQIDAARKFWQQHGELKKISYEQLLDAASTYIDLLAAYSAKAIAANLEKAAQEILDDVQKKFDMSEGKAEFALLRAQVKAEVDQQRQMQVKLQGQIDAANAKLCYLLGLEPHTHLVPIDTQMAAFELVDARQTVESLVQQALISGPGIREIEGILNVIQCGLDANRGYQRYLPTIKLQLNEGLFAAGPGSTLDWANRWDMALQARWNLTDALTAKNRKRVALANLQQAHQTYEELKAKLTLGVQEARSTIEATGSQFDSAEELIRLGKEALENTVKLSKFSSANVNDYTVLQAHKAVALAQLNYIEQMREFDKAQLRLFVLVGGGNGTAPVGEMRRADEAPPSPPSPPQ
jgi:outer membrane protein TolC